jgi:hypothetical protein
MIDFYSSDKLLQEGTTDNKFKVWLGCNFGYYTQGLLIDANWDSTVVYQYDTETDKLRSTFNELSFENVNKWRIYKDDNDELYIGLYWNDGLWGAYVMSWLTYEKPEYVVLP